MNGTELLQEVITLQPEARRVLIDEEQSDAVGSRRQLTDDADGFLRRIDGEDTIVRRELSFEIALNGTQYRQVVVNG